MADFIVYEPVVDMFDKGGWVLVGIVIVSTIAWSLVFYEWLALVNRTSDWQSVQRAVNNLSTRPDNTRSSTRPSLDRIDYEGSFIGRLLRSNVIDRRIARESFEAQVVPILESEAVMFGRTLRTVGVLAGALPLLGLLGTVFGMIQTFDTLTVEGVAQVDAMAGGISQALITTQAGLVIAVPILLVNRYLGARIRKYLELSRVMLKKIETAICFEDEPHLHIASLHEDHPQLARGGIG